MPSCTTETRDPGQANVSAHCLATIGPLQYIIFLDPACYKLFVLQVNPPRTCVQTLLKTIVLVMRSATCKKDVSGTPQVVVLAQPLVEIATVLAASTVATRQRGVCMMEHNVLILDLFVSVLIV